MTTKDALKTMTRIAPYMGEIFDDEDASVLIDSIREGKGDSLAGTAMAKALPLFADRHRDALCGMIAVSTGKKPEDVLAQPIRDTISDMQNMLLDETILFFMGCLRLVRNI